MEEQQWSSTKPMIELDSRTAFVALVLTHFTFGLAIIIPLRSQWTPSLARLAYAMLCGGVGLLLFALRDVWPDYLTRIASNILVSLEFMFIYWSACLYYGHPISWVWKYVPPILCAITFSILQDQAHRNLASGILHGAQFVPTLMLAVRQGIATQTTQRMMFIAGLAILAGQSVLRITTNAWAIPWQADTSAAADPFTLLAGMVAALLVVTSMLLKHWDRSETNLRKQRDVAQMASANKTRFLAAASHDLRQPMQASTLYLEALGSEPLNEAQHALYIKLVVVANEMRSLLDALLDVARLDSGGVKAKFATLAVDRLFRRLDEDFAPSAMQKKLRWKLYWRHGEILHTDPNLLYTLIGNLISNAIKYTNEGGILVTVRKRGGRMLVQVWDTGIGISPEHGDRIFDEFYQINNPSRSRAHGVGLGLSIVKRLTELLNCDLSWRSAPGQGTVFSLLLPTYAGPGALPEADIDTGDEYKMPEHLTRIIVVEDNEAIRDALIAWCRNKGKDVVGYSSAEAALLRDDLSASDFFLVDFRLEGSMTGLDLLKELQRRFGTVWGVIATGDSKGDTTPLGGSPWPVLTKPVSPPDLLKAINVPPPRRQVAAESTSPEKVEP